MSVSYIAPLCLACASSLPPKQTEDTKPFFTRCCNRPICRSCVERNPRLTRYDPCLACLGGVSAVGGRVQPFSGSGEVVMNRNVDAAVRDEDVFVLGDDDEDGDNETDLTPPPPYSEPSSSINDSTEDNATSGRQEVTPADPRNTFDSFKPVSGPPSYYIQPRDTLLGIALKFQVDGRLLCRLNNLPPSTLSTTPHLLHTRRTITLPAFAKTEGKDHVITGALPADSGDAARDRIRRENRAREVARSRFQTLTREADPDVVRAYVAIADDVEDAAEFDMKQKEGRYEGRETAPLREVNGEGSSLEARAVSRFMDDEEWEESERRNGRGVAIQKFPVSSRAKGKEEATASGVSRFWGLWRQ